MKKNRLFVLGIITMFVAILSLTLVSGTMARYTSTVTGSDNVTVAKWEWEYKDDQLELNNDVVSFDLFNTIKDEDGSAENDVAAGLIAPGTSGSFELKFKNTSEVNAEITISFTSDEKVPQIKYSIDGGTTWVDTLAELNFVGEDIAMGGTLIKTVLWKWSFEPGTGDTWTDATDTEFGKTPVTQTVSMSVTFDQVQ